MNTVIMGMREFFLTSCEQYGHMLDTKQQYIEVVGKFITHDGNQVWLELNGCGASDSHTFTHRNSFFGYLNEMYKGKIVRVKGERRFDWKSETWGYSWTLHCVNVWEQGMDAAPANIKNMCGTNC